MSVATESHLKGNTATKCPSRIQLCPRTTFKYQYSSLQLIKYTDLTSNMLPLLAFRIIIVGKIPPESRKVDNFSSCLVQGNSLSKQIKIQVGFLENVVCRLPILTFPEPRTQNSFFWMTVPTWFCASKTTRTSFC